VFYLLRCNPALQAKNINAPDCAQRFQLYQINISGWIPIAG
jgi:hypothetical protein